MSDDQQARVPTSDLDFNMMMIDSTWGQPDVPQELKDHLSEDLIEYDENNNPVVTKRSLWGLLGYYKRDIRLANLDSAELADVRHYLDIAGICLTTFDKPLVKSFSTALSFAVTIMETSQSKKGFLRTKMNTLRQESVNQTIEPPKKGFFGGSKKTEGGY